MTTSHFVSHPFKDSAVYNSQAMASLGYGCATISPLLSLPPELQLYLSRSLDLATLIAYSAHVSKVLRNIFASFQRIPLYLVPAHRLSLVEWRRAAIQLRSLGLIHHTPSFQPEQAVSLGKALKTSERDLILDESATDLRFLLDVIRCLVPDQGGPQHTSSSQVYRVSRDALPITTLSAVSWHGIAGLDLIRILDRQPILSQTETIVKTERLDHRVWAEITRAVAENPDGCIPAFILNPDVNHMPVRSGLRTVPGNQDDSNDEHAFRYNRCSAAQAIVQVGKLRKAAPGDRRLKGEGLQIGFQGLCLEEEEQIELQPTEQDVLLTDGDDKSNATTVVKRRLHVIYQGRFMKTKDESLEIDELFRRSIVTCTNCKHQITF